MPDPLLVLLLVASGWATLRAVESGRTKHLVWAGAFVGLAFMTKMLQGWMVFPALAATYLFAGTPRLAVRLRQLALAGLVMVAVSASRGRSPCRCGRAQRPASAAPPTARP